MTLDALEALLSEATPGPWWIDRDVYREEDWLMADGKVGIGPFPLGGWDAKFISELRNAAPALIAIARVMQQLASRQCVQRGTDADPLREPLCSCSRCVAARALAALEGSKS